MNSRQKKFCEIYAECGNALQAYTGAGYIDTKAAKANASRLLARDDIKAEVKRITDRMKDARIQKTTDRMVWLTAIVYDPEEKTSDRLKAAELLGKMQGDFVQKVQVQTGAVFLDDDLED